MCSVLPHTPPPLRLDLLAVVYLIRYALLCRLVDASLAAPTLYRERLIALHGFIKKTRTTPGEDLALARTRQKELEQ